MQEYPKSFRTPQEHPGAAVFQRGGGMPEGFGPHSPQELESAMRTALARPKGLEITGNLGTPNIFEPKRVSALALCYPTFPIYSDGKTKVLLPRILLPPNYKELVPEFYRRGGKEDVEIYAKEVTAALSELKIKIIPEEKTLTGVPVELNLEDILQLKWDTVHGLRGISFGDRIGYFLTQQGRPSFETYDMTTKTSLLAGPIAMHYVAKLLSCE